MHSTYARINNVTAFLSSCTMALLAAIALSSLLFTADPKGEIHVSPMQIYAGNTRRYMNKKQDVAFLNFNVTADLTPLFNWNTKQLFLYVQAEYTNAQGVQNEVVIWDKIVRSKEEADLALTGRNKYLFRNLGSSFKNVKPAHFSLKYNVMPYVGLLTYGEAARTVEPVPFPEKRSEVA
ncbi:signal peptidase 22kDa subunit [Irpex lacteus]|nr:signal peptidase 22kDa subunit [Irpex lacteus]